VIRLRRTGNIFGPNRKDLDHVFFYAENDCTMLLTSLGRFPFLPLALLAFLLSCGSSIFGQPVGPGQTIPTVGYCELRQTPQLFDDKIIRVRATYIDRFELSAIYDEACIDRRSLAVRETWVNGVFPDDRTPSATNPTTNVEKIISTLRKQGGGEIQAVIVGKFHGGSEFRGFGHLGGSRFQIDVIRVEEARLLPLKQDGCSRIDETERFHYLTLVRVASGRVPIYQNGPAVEESRPFSEDGKSSSAKGRKEQLVWLRLVNNSSCPVVVPTASAYRSNTAEGKETYDLNDKAEVAVLYELFPRAARQETRQIESSHRTTSVLPPGRSVYFSVPLRYFIREHFDVRVSFDYPSGKAEAHYEPFYFSAFELPGNLRDKIVHP
jgi:hypothetical protein